MNSPVRDYVCVDLETTGLHPKTDKIIEIGAVRVRSGRPVKTWRTFVNPGRKLEEQTKEITGITPQTAAEKGMPEVDFAKRVFKELNTPATISVGYNSIGFDDKVNRALFWRR